MSCPICCSALTEAFQTTILGKYEEKYLICNNCGYLKAENPHWLDEAYTRAIANADTGLVARNFVISNKLSRILYWLFPDKGRGKYLDIAGGYGMLVRIMRDNGFDYYWKDKFCENQLAPGFDYDKSIGNFSVITAIEVFEHLIDPVSFVRESFELSGAEALIFTTELYKGNPPSPKEWWYYSFETGQHIGFFKEQTLKKIADNLGFYFFTSGGMHIYSKMPINQILFKTMTNSYLAQFPPFLIRRSLGSKTFSDHLMIMNKMIEK